MTFPSSRARGRSPYGLPARLLALPARRRVRWALILVLMAAFAGLYLHVLSTAGPLPPSRVPIVRLDTAWQETVR
jgi:hypothetical protein